MLEQATFADATSVAGQYSAVFVENYLESQYAADNLELCENHGVSTVSSPLYLALLTFADHLAIQVVPYTGLPQGFASWLFTAQHQIFVALDPGKMQSWYQQHRFSIETQKIRSLVHEIGHTLLSPIVTSNTVGRAPIHSVTPEEEEKAWLFAMTFLGAVMADYARRRRQTKGWDDALVVPI